jgi:broad specificity phosphatase PhoE
MKKEEFKVYVFRHGQTYYNRDKIFTGWKDSKLTPLGIKQAKVIAKKLENKKIGAAFHTRLSRSKDTLKEILKYHSECKKKIEDDRMIERSYGVLEGKSHQAFINRAGQKQYDLIHRGYDVAAPKGESFKDVEKRVGNFINDLINFIKKNQVNVAISAHGNSIRLFRKIMEKTTREEAVNWTIPYDKYFEYSIKV